MLVEPRRGTLWTASWYFGDLSWHIYHKRQTSSLTYAKALRKHLAIMQERIDQCFLQSSLFTTKNPLHSSLWNLKRQLVWIFHIFQLHPKSGEIFCIYGKNKSGWWVDWEIQPWNMGLRWLGRIIPNFEVISFILIHSWYPWRNWQKCMDRAIDSD